MRLYGFVYCTLTVSELVNKGIDTYLPNCNFSDSLRGGGKGGGRERVSLISVPSNVETKLEGFLLS